MEYGPKISSLNFSSAKNAEAVISVTTATPWFIWSVFNFIRFCDNRYSIIGQHAFSQFAKIFANTRRKHGI